MEWSCWTSCVGICGWPVVLRREKTVAGWGWLGLGSEGVTKMVKQWWGIGSWPYYICQTESNITYVLYIIYLCIIYTICTCIYTYDQTIGKVDPNWEVDPFKFVTISIPRVSMDYHPPPYFNAILLCLFKPLFLAASYRMGPPFSIAWTVAVDVCGWIWLGLW